MQRLKRKLSYLVVDRDPQNGQRHAHWLSQSAGCESAQVITAKSAALSVLGMVRIDVLLVNADAFTTSDLQDLAVSSPESLLVLLTRNPLFRINGSSLKVFDCLVLPLNQSRLSLSIGRIEAHFAHLQGLAGEEDKASQPHVLIRSGGMDHRLPTADLLYIESDGEYLKYHTPHTRYMALGSLRRQALALGEDFVQVHRSYAVNRAHVRSKTRLRIELVGNRMIPIGKTYRNAFQFASNDVIF